MPARQPHPGHIIMTKGSGSKRTTGVGRRPTTTLADLKMENARLTRELTERTDTLSEALEQQKATAEILNVISSSPADTQPVFAAIAKNAARLCHAMYSGVFSFDGKLTHFVAGHGFTEEAHSSAGPQSPGDHGWRRRPCGGYVG